MMKRALACAAVLALLPAPALPQQSPYAEYQRMTAESAPIELYELAGEEMWKKRQGPKNASLEQCDLGQGPGVLKGAYAGLPRYFADADRVMDLETRLLHCMMTLQGRSREEATKRVFGNADTPSEMEVLSAYVAGQSHGMPMRPGRSHAKEGFLQLGQTSSIAQPWTTRARLATARRASASACPSFPCSTSRNTRAR
jgi:sulfur-oxidizing protein SoxA